MKGLISILSRHGRFYIALGLGVGTALIAHLAGFEAPLMAGGDVFYLVFLGLCFVLIAGQKTSDLKQRAKTEDEGIGIVLLIILATMAFFTYGVFTALNKKHGLDIPPLILAGGGAPLGWAVLHTVMAFHYATIHYFDDPDCVGDEKDLLFPGNGDPGPASQLRTLQSPVLPAAPDSRGRDQARTTPSDRRSPGSLRSR